jgi:hypothetical protein
MSGRSDQASSGADTARNMADALTYLGRVAGKAGYSTVAADIQRLSERLTSIANAEEAVRRAGAEA